MNTAEVQLMTREDMERELQISFGTLKVLIKEGTLPNLRPLGSGRLLYVRRDDFYAAINAMLPPIAPAPAGVAAPAPEGATMALPAPPPIARQGRPKYQGSATDRARQRDARKLSQMNSK
jgi:hypothetical protein